MGPYVYRRLQHCRNRHPGLADCVFLHIFHPVSKMEVDAIPSRRRCRLRRALRSIAPGRAEPIGSPLEREGVSTMRTARYLAAILGALLLLSPAMAQELTSGAIAGKVGDPAGRPIAGAVI